MILTYDSDGAGVKAALRAIPILKEAGISVKVLNMRPYKDPDEFMKNLGPEAFRQRIEEAKNSFLFEIDVLKSQYDMEDPEQKTRFYQETARRLLEFPEALERDNYIQAVSKEHMIPYEDLRRLVNQLGSRMAPGSSASLRSSYSQEERKPSPKKDKEEGNRRSQRLLLTWLIENPKLFERIQGIITAEDFVEPLYQKVAQMVFQAYENHSLNPAQILNHFINDQEQYREVAALFNASLNESLSNEEQKKAFSETVMKVKKHSLDQASRQAKDMKELQQIIQAQAALRSLHISLDEGTN